MKKKFTLILASLLLTMGAWAQVSLKFNRTGTAASSVTVSVVDEDGNAIDGASATVVSSHEFKASNNAITEAILCPNVNANTNHTIELTFTINGLPQDFSFNQLGMHIHALNGSSNYQETADNVVRQWNVSTTVDDADFGSLNDIDIAAGITGANKVWELNGETISKNSLTLKLTITKGTENGGCFFGLSEVKLATVLTHTLSVGEAGWATLMVGCNTTIPSGVNVYAVSSVTNTSAILTPVSGVIPANEAVLVEAAEGDYYFGFTTEPGSVGENLLEGSLFNCTVSEEAYVLSTVDGKTAFYQVDLTEGAFECKANKAYLPKTAASARFLSFDFGTETGIIETETGNEKSENSVVYDLAGRRVQKAQKGLYIVNGAIVIK